MKTIREIFRGIGAYGKAFRFVQHHRLYYLFIAPLVLLVLLLIGSGVGIGFAGSEVLDLLKEQLGAGGWNLNLPGWALAIVSGLVGFAFLVIWLFLFALLGGALTLILLSPFLAYASEKTEELITGKEYPFSLKQTLKDAWHGSLIAARNFFLQLAFTIIIFVCSLIIPLIGPLLAAFATFFVVSYFYGFSFLDFTNERQRMRTRDRLAYVKQNRGLSVGCGTGFYAILLVPYFGAFLAPFVAILGTIAGTIVVLERQEEA